ncbi:MAG: methionyl-tRNA formyltransferase [Bacilli bacterium]|nr:methionyl-tRNA formyltransferase [Bacilli bacterium]
MSKTVKDLKVVFMGTPEFSVPILESLIELTDVVLVVSQPDKEVGRKRVLTPSPVKKCALEHGIEVYTPKRLRDEYEYILNKKPDVIITAAYGQIVPKQMLIYPDYGCINVHGSLLPKYRGASPIQSAIMNGDKTTGITLMYMEEGLDTGNIIHAKEIPIEDDDTYGTLSEKLSILGRDLLVKTLPVIVDGENFDIPQNDDEATSTVKIKREDERLEFNKTATELHNFVRALNPRPLANILVNGEEWKVLTTEVGDSVDGKLGEVVEVNKDSFVVACKDSSLIVKKIKPAGKKEMFVKDFFNGFNKESLKGVVLNEER